MDIARFTETIPPERFDISFWWSEFEECGCIVGHMAMARKFGFEPRDLDLIKDGQGWSPIMGKLGVTDDECMAMFSAGTMSAVSMSPKQAAERVRAVALTYA
jgi:hypothetical protein